MRGMAGRVRWWIGALLLAAVATAACSQVQLFTKAGIRSQDGWFLVAAEFAQYEPIRPTELSFELRETSQVTITFSAVGYVQATEPPAPFTAPMLLQCRLDGQPCSPGFNESQIQFLFPHWRPNVLCCDSRAYTWVVPRLAKGPHTVMIWGQIRNPELVTIANVSDWSLVIHAVGL